MGSPCRLGRDVAAVLSGAERYAVVRRRAETFADSLPDGCVQLLLLDPPYYGVKGEAWDNAWPSEDAFLEWMGDQCARWRRVLAPTGTLYVFAGPRMGARVEVEIRRCFSVLSSIVWAKPAPRSAINPGAGPAGRCRKEAFRAFFPAHERCIMAEHLDAGARDDARRAEAFAPLIAYLDGERVRAGLRRPDIDRALACQMSGHWFTRTQWELPHAEAYERLRALFDDGSDQRFLARSYDDVRAQYEALRQAWVSRERRPFSVTSEVPHTDVWTYPTVQHYDGKHPCEKPGAMARDIVRASSRPGDVVADFFAGSGCFLAWAVKLGRRAIGCDMSAEWANKARARCAVAAASTALGSAA